MRCNGAFRFAALVGVRGEGRRRRPVDRALRPDRRAERRASRRAGRRPREGSVVHARDRRSGAPRPRRIPSRDDDEGRRQSGGNRGRSGGGDAGRRARRRASSRAATTAPSLFARGSRDAPGPIVDPSGRGRRASRRAVAVYARPASRDRRSAHPSRSTRSAPTSTRTRSSSAHGGCSARRASTLAVACTSKSTRSRRSSGTAPRPWVPRASVTDGGFSLELAEPVEAVAPGQVAVLYDGDVVVGAGVIERATG